MTVPALRELAAARGPLRFVGNATAAALAPELFASVEPIDDPRWAGLFDDGVPLPAADGLAVVLLRDRACAERLRRAGWRVDVDADPLPAEGSGHVAAHLLAAVGSGRRVGAYRNAVNLRAADPRAGPYVVIHPGSGSPRKNWPVERFAAVIGRLDAPTVITAGPADADVAAHLLRLSSTSTTLAANRPLSELAAMLAGAALYVGNDSGVSHVAGAVGAPTVAIFGPTDPARWAPWGPRVSVVPSPEWPSIDEVFAAAHSLLTGAAA